MITTQKKFYITFLVFVIAFGILLKFGVFSFLTDIKKISNGFALEKNNLDLFQAQLGDIRKFQEKYYSYEPILNQFNSSFVDWQSPIGFIEFLEKEAKFFNVSIKIMPSRIISAPNGSWIKLPFSIFIGGQFQNCLKFLARLQKSNFLVDILSLNIERVPKEHMSSKKFTSLNPGDVLVNLSLIAFSKNSLAEDNYGN